MEFISLLHCFGEILGRSYLLYNIASFQRCLRAFVTAQLSKHAATVSLWSWGVNLAIPTYFTFNTVKMLIDFTVTKLIKQKCRHTISTNWLTCIHLAKTFKLSIIIKQQPTVPPMLNKNMWLYLLHCLFQVLFINSATSPMCPTLFLSLLALMSLHCSYTLNGPRHSRLF